MDARLLGDVAERRRAHARRVAARTAATDSSDGGLSRSAHPGPEQPRGKECSDRAPSAVISNSSPVCTPAVRSGVHTLGCTTTVIRSCSGSACTPVAGRGG